MDDRSKGIGNRDDMAGRSPEDITARSTESMGDYGRTTERGRFPDGAADTDEDLEATRIRRDIEETREEMSETIDAIQEKLRPANVVANATQQVKQAATERMRQMTQSAGDAANRVMYGTGGRSQGFIGGIRQNPVPAALIGIGAAWWYMNSRSGSRGDSRYYYDERYRASEDYTDPAFRTYDRSGDYDSGSVSESAQQVAAGAQEYTREAVQRVRESGRRAQTELERLSRENPLAVAAGALLLGAAVGLAIPETERENELLGETRDSMVDRAQELARNAASRAQDVAGDLAGEAASRIVKGSDQ
jgi:hypothetical protein